MPEWILQTLILLTSAVSQYMYAFVDASKRRPAYVITLCAQPIWLWTSLRHGQWAVAILSFWFAYNAIRGIRAHWGNGE